MDLSANIKKPEIKKEINPSKNEHGDSLISFLAEVPTPLKKAMEAFIETHPNWDQYRLIQAALSGFLVQSGVESRAINRMYCENMFSKKSFGKNL